MQAAGRATAARHTCGWRWRHQARIAAVLLWLLLLLLLLRRLCLVVGLIVRAQQRQPALQVQALQRAPALAAAGAAATAAPLAAANNTGSAHGTVRGAAAGRAAAATTACSSVQCSRAPAGLAAGPAPAAALGSRRAVAGQLEAVCSGLSTPCLFVARPRRVLNGCNRGALKRNAIGGAGDGAMQGELPGGRFTEKEGMPSSCGACCGGVRDCGCNREPRNPLTRGSFGGRQWLPYNTSRHQ